MREYDIELEKRVKFIQDIIARTHSNGIVYGNSGGKDSTLVGILCKMACVNTVGIIMPCSSQQNYTTDKEDAILISRMFNIETREIDLRDIRDSFTNCINSITDLSESAITNLVPRIRMTVLYAVAASESKLVAGTGNRSEEYVGYFTKWGDGAYDFNPIVDLTVNEIYDFLRFLNVPSNIINKAPSAGLFDGQTDEKEMGIGYQIIDNYLLNDIINDKDRKLIERMHMSSEHKRNISINFGGAL